MYQIPAKSASRILDSVAFMNSEFGVAFNALITLNFEQLGLAAGPPRAQALTDLNIALARKFQRHCARFSQTGEGEHYFVYAHERTRNHGHHIHELVVMPYGLQSDLSAWLQRWRERNFGAHTAAAAVDIRSQPRPKTLVGVAENQARMVRYILKNLEPAGTTDRDGRSAQLHDLLGLEEVKRSLPLQVDRIVGTSANISQKAIMRAGYNPPHAWEELLSVQHLRAFHARVQAAELTEQLRAINL